MQRLSPPKQLELFDDRGAPRPAITEELWRRVRLFNSLFEDYFGAVDAATKMEEEENDDDSF